VAPTLYDRVRTYLTRLDRLDIPRMNRLVAEMEEQVTEDFKRDGLERIALHRHLDMRYHGQAYELRVPLRGGAVIASTLEAAADAFHAAHEAAYGFRRPGHPVELVNVRVTGVAPPPRLGVIPPPVRRTPAVASRRPVWFWGSWVEAPIYRREDLAPGVTLTGPAVIEELGATTVLAPGDRLSVDALGNLLIDVGPAPGHKAAA